MEFFSTWTAQDFGLLLLVAYVVGEKTILSLRGKPSNGGHNNKKLDEYVTKDMYNNQRPDWFKEYETRHDNIHNKIGEKLTGISEAVTRIDERTKNASTPKGENN